MSVIRESLPGEGRQHQCDICMRWDVWGPSWKTYGSIRIEESCGHYVSTCSDPCRDSIKGRAIIAGFAFAHPKKTCAGWPA